MTLTSETRAPVGTRERPIIFSGPMVRAILAGRKSMTRRILKPQPPEGARYTGIHYACDEPPSWFFNSPRCGHKVRQAFEEGDHLWVKETHMFVGGGDPGIPLRRADWRDDAARQGLENIPAEEPKGWRSPLFMPRWASRLTLEVTEVRVERLQDISEADAVAEGICPCGGGWSVAPDDVETSADTARWAYQKLWCRLHGPASYEANPWVAAITFRLLPANESQKEGAADSASVKERA